jgi:hypothetical protein
MEVQQIARRAECQAVCSRVQMSLDVLTWMRLDQAEAARGARVRVTLSIPEIDVATKFLKYL